MTQRRSLLIATGLAPILGPLAMPGLVRAQAAPRVRFTLDWAFQAPNAFAIVARERGFYREAGVDVAIDRGQGSGGVPVSLAAGTHDVGYADLSPTLRFLSENPGRDIIAIAILHDRSPLCVITRADGPIRTPADLVGRRLAAPDNDAARQLFPAFARAVNIDPARVNFLSVSPALREPMLLRREADGITAHIATAGIALQGLGMRPEDQRVFMYNDHGLDLYGGAILTTRTYAERNPDVLRRVVAASMRGFISQAADPNGAMDILKRVEPLTDVPLELSRHRLTMERLIVTDHVRRNGISSVSMERLQKSLEAVQQAFNLSAALPAAQVYTPAYLPPAEQLRLPASAT
ncbi:ABC transporter substrate-binding protein [Sediminicoccus sp. KRV36]|uniref:ABC transporter substrate-binding protein n=1 Tax=Sediminicoccus sp. KRV36 TaxID=3133721 RepID=UPI00200ED2B2|nr:ABC transporter substrate-binding protein [Sediminicoccus rosea]UPY37899.1 ABC transporter substrate-binding protein [Sediminicoccus rosea]